MKQKEANCLASPTLGLSETMIVKKSKMGRMKPNYSEGNYLDEKETRNQSPPRSGQERRPLWDNVASC